MPDVRDPRLCTCSAIRAISSMPSRALATKTPRLALIEDCSQAHLAPVSRTGWWARFRDIGCFSFQQSKHMTTGDGGMTITLNQASI